MKKVQNRSRQIRRDRSKLRRKYQADIDAARARGDLAEASALEAKLSGLLDRWALGLNSRSAQIFEPRKGKPVGENSYFVR